MEHTFWMKLGKDDTTAEAIGLPPISHGARKGWGTEVLGWGCENGGGSAVSVSHPFRMMREKDGAGRFWVGVARTIKFGANAERPALGLAVLFAA